MSVQYNIGQTFYLDPDAVSGADNIYLTDIQLFFRQIPAANNASGNPSPGVTIHISKTSGNNVPDTNNVLTDSYSFVDYTGINTSSNANTPTIFSFAQPVPINTGDYYAILISLESPEFILWTSVQGANLVGTNIVSPGPSGKYAGDYFEFGNDGTITPKADTDLTFIVDVAQFTANEATIDMVNEDFEFLSYSNISNTFIGGEYIYQDFGGLTNGALSANVTFYGKGTINIDSNTFSIFGNGTSFTNSITGFTPNDFIVITDGTLNNVDVLQVNAITNDTYLSVITSPTFSNTAGFYKKTVVGTLFDTDYPDNILILNNSSANSTVQFSNSSIATFVINVGGTGYNNSDFIQVSGGNSSINAIANLTTNSIGGIVKLNVANSGFGFVNTGVLTIKAANGAISNGISANIAPSVGATLRGELSQAYCALNFLIYFGFGAFTPEVLVKVPDISIQNVFANFVQLNSDNSYALNANNEFLADIDTYTQSPFNTIILSKSVELNTPNSALANVDGVFKSAVLSIDFGINQSNTALFTSPYVYSEKLDLIVFENEINNDATNEQTDMGNAISKHLTTSITIANNIIAQALSVTISAYQPAGTNVAVYARILNPNDPESFNKKLWSPLVVTTGSGLVSSSVDANDFIQYTYGIPPYPTTLSTLAASVTVSNNSFILNTTADLTGVLSSGNLIKVYNPTPSISQGDYFITVVQSINTTAIVCSTSTVNNSIIGSGFAVDLLQWPQSAFEDPQNANIVTYYNKTMAEFNGFNTVALKLVLLSNNTTTVPKVSSLRMVCGPVELPDLVA